MNLSLTKANLERTEYQQNKSKLNRKVEICISKVKEEIWFVNAILALKISSANSLD